MIYMGNIFFPAKVTLFRHDFSVGTHSTLRRLVLVRIINIERVCVYLKLYFVVLYFVNIRYMQDRFP